MSFFNYYLFHYSKLQMTIVKNLIMGFKGSYEVLLRHKYFWYTHFWQWNGGPSEIFWNLHGNAFCSLIFLKWRNIATSLLMLHLNSAVMHYANLNSRSINKSFLNYGPLRQFYTRRNVSGMSWQHCFFWSCTCVKVLLTETFLKYRFRWKVEISSTFTLRTNVAFFLNQSFFCIHVTKWVTIIWLNHSPQCNLKVKWLRASTWKTKGLLILRIFPWYWITKTDLC